MQGEAVSEERELSAYHENGVSVRIESVEKSDQGILVQLRAINGTDDTIEISDQNDPIFLTDNKSNKYPAKTEKIELQPFTNNMLQIEFYESSTASTDSLTLFINSKYSNQFRSPQLTINDIPFPSGGKQIFKVKPPANLENLNKTANHPNGSTVTIKAIRFGETETEVDLTAVNGGKYDMKLASGNNDNAYLQDQKSRRFYLVPPQNNTDLEIPDGQKMSGTFRFAGTIPADSNTLSIYFNERIGQDSEYSRSPKIILSDIKIR